MSVDLLTLPMCADAESEPKDDGEEHSPHTQNAPSGFASAAYHAPQGLCSLLLGTWNQVMV